MELLKDYDCSIFYHPGKENLVANALSRKSVGSLAHISTERRSIIKELHELIKVAVERDKKVYFISIQSMISVLG